MSDKPQQPQAFLKLWETDKYAIARTAALRWLGDRYLLAKPINRKTANA